MLESSCHFDGGTGVLRGDQIMSEVVEREKVWVYKDTWDRMVKSAQEWRSMDTAPLDGREVILRVKMRAGIPFGILVGHFMGGGHCIEDHPPIARGWYFWTGRVFDEAAEPIEWMPLP